MSTALRAAAPDRGPDGTRLLREPRQTYADGAEQRILEILRASTDVSSLSAELLPQATSWAERYHLSPQRGVILEFLDIPAGTKVLEIGAGCGPITRHLGERGAVVDAVEPMPARAAANRERNRDLPNVEVFVGEVEDVPDEPVYDLVVVIGVLEYVGGGGTDQAPYLEFLSGLARRLKPGGRLALAIENQLGVKYFAGAEEDHTGRLFDGLEGYPHQNYPGQPHHGAARTFSRNQLTDLLVDAGFQVDDVLAAFPDYKITRAVLHPTLDDIDPTLAHRIPHFPSPDWVQPRPHLLSEGRLWRTLVSAGLTWEFPNSFLVCARVGEGGTPLWPEGRLAGFANLERQPDLMATTILQRTPTGAEFARSFVGRPDGGGHRTSVPLVPGRDLIEVLAESDDDTLAALLQRWVALLRATVGDHGAPVDAVPHNLIVRPDGELQFIDDEFTPDGWSFEDVLARGLLWCAHQLSLRTSPDRWQPAGSLLELVQLLWERTLPDTALPNFDEVLDREAQIQTEVAGGTVAGHRTELVGLIHRDLRHGAPGLTLDAKLSEVATRAHEVEGLEHRVATLESGLAAELTHRRKLEADIEYLTGSLAGALEHADGLATALEVARTDAAEARGELAWVRDATGRAEESASTPDLVAELVRARDRLAEVETSRTFQIARRMTTAASKIKPGRNG